MGPRAAAALHESQRRDQHAARQRELDARPRAGPEEPALRRRALQGVPSRRALPVGLGELRQRARDARHGRPLAARGDDDDDPRGLAEGPLDERRQARVLRVPLLHHGALGWAGVDRLHRRPLHRRGPRPQRAASESLDAHPRRHRGDGQRSGRAPDRSRAREGEGSPATWAHVLGRFRARADGPRRGDQGTHGDQEALRAVAA